MERIPVSLGVKRKLGYNQSTSAKITTVDDQLRVDFVKRHINHMDELSHIDFDLNSACDTGLDFVFHDPEAGAQLKTDRNVRMIEFSDIREGFKEVDS